MANAPSNESVHIEAIYTQHKSASGRSMGFFGIVEPTTGSAQISVASVHINVWAFHRSNNPLGVFDLFPNFGQHVVYVDVGVHLEVHSGVLGHLHLALPGGVASQSLVDLSPFVLDPETNEFIFGGPVHVDGEKIQYIQDGDHGDVVVPVQHLVESGSRLSLLVLDRHLVTNLGTTSYYYIRFRYRCARPSELIRHKPWGFNKRGIIFDLRANDVRTAPNPIEPASLMGLRKIYLFAVLPISYVPVLSNPPLHYSRLLESPHWRSYLDSCSKGYKKGTFTTYYWKGTKEPVTTDKPLRAFMHLQNEFGVWFLVLYLGGILVPSILALLRLFLS